MKILIILEDNNGKIHRMGLESIVAAQTMASDLNGSIVGVVIGKNADALANEVATYKLDEVIKVKDHLLDNYCLLYTSPSPRDRTRSRMPSSA